MRTPVRPVLSVTALASVGLLAASVAVAAPASADVTTSRIEGPDRITTAVEVARQRTGGDGTSSTVLLARADDVADALAGGGLSHALGGAPVLLTDGARLSTPTARALAELGATRVVVLGGAGAISAAVVQELDQAYDVQRLAGADRYATAAQVAREMSRLTGTPGTVGGLSTVLVASGTAPADALSAGALAGAAGVPVLLVEPERVGPTTAQLLTELQPDQVLVLGGEQAVPAAVEQELTRLLGSAPLRLAGPDRQSTAVAIADFAVAAGALGVDQVVLSAGGADALTGGALAGSVRAPALLTRGPDDLGAPARDWVVRHCAALSRVHVVGGEAAVSPGVLSAVRAAASCDQAVPGFQPVEEAAVQPLVAPAELLLSRVEVGVHPGFERVVLHLDGEGRPGWDVRYDADPRQQGTGAAVQVQGRAVLRVDVTGVTYPTLVPEPGYGGPDQLQPQATDVVRQVVVGTVYEGRRSVFVGLGTAVPFRVFSLTSPARLVIDVHRPG